MEIANTYLPEFAQDYNRRFGRPARSDHDGHRPLSEHDNLDDVFTWQEQRRVSIRFQGVAVAARPFHKDGCVTQGSIEGKKLLSGALTEIRKRQQREEKALVKSAKSKREKRIVRDRFAGSLGP